MRWGQGALRVCWRCAGGNAAALGDTAASVETLFVVRRGWHIDIGFTVADLEPPMNSFAAEFPGAKYLLFGFGDRRYLTSPHHGPAMLLRALWPDAGLLLGTGLRSTPAIAFGAANVVELTIPRADALQAQYFVWQSLSATQQSDMTARAIDSHALVGIPGPYQGSSFYYSRDVYSAVHTCNTWAAEALRRAGLGISSRGVVFAPQLWRRVRRIHSVLLKPETRLAD